MQKSSFGAMNPQIPQLGDDPNEWGRWDVPAHRTTYSSNYAPGVYVETSQSFRFSPAASPPLDQLFDNEAGTSATLNDAIHQEWMERHGGWTPGKMPAGWRDFRTLYHLRLPNQGWFVDIEVGDTVTAITAS